MLIKNFIKNKTSNKKCLSCRENKNFKFLYPSAIIIISF